MNTGLGLLLCPTTLFAALLREPGRQRAREDVVRERSPVYSGVIRYEKAARESPFLGMSFMTISTASPAPGARKKRQNSSAIPMFSKRAMR